MSSDHKVYRQYAYLRITGYGHSSLITERLGVQPDQEWSEGDPWREEPMNKKRFFTCWKLNSDIPETEDLNIHIESVLGQIQRKRTEVLSLHGEYKVSMVCVSYNLQGFSFELNFELQRTLTSFGIGVEFDAYIDQGAHELVYDLRKQLENNK